MDRLTSLMAFVRVVDAGGFSAAGRKLNMSTTMVSNHVQSLEDRLGARLLHRTTRRSASPRSAKLIMIAARKFSQISNRPTKSLAPRSRCRAAHCAIYTATHIVPFVAPVIAEFLPGIPRSRLT